MRTWATNAATVATFTAIHANRRTRSQPCASAPGYRRHTWARQSSARRVCAAGTHPQARAISGGSCPAPVAAARLRGGFRRLQAHGRARGCAHGRQMPPQSPHLPRSTPTGAHGRSPARLRPVIGGTPGRGNRARGASAQREHTHRRAQSPAALALRRSRRRVCGADLGALVDYNNDSIQQTTTTTNGLYDCECDFTSNSNCNCNYTVYTASRTLPRNCPALAPQLPRNCPAVISSLIY